MNVIGTLGLADAASQAGCHLTVYATGCIYSYDEEHPIGGKGFVVRISPFNHTQILNDFPKYALISVCRKRMSPTSVAVFTHRQKLLWKRYASICMNACVYKSDMCMSAWVGGYMLTLFSVVALLQQYARTTPPYAHF